MGACAVALATIGGASLAIARANAVALSKLDGVGEGAEGVRGEAEEAEEPGESGEAISKPRSTRGRNCGEPGEEGEGEEILGTMVDFCRLCRGQTLLSIRS